MKWIFAFLIIVTLTAQARPIAEYEQNALFIHTLAKDFVGPFFRGESTFSGEGYTPHGYENLNLLWLRDRFPFQAINKKNELVNLSYFNLINPNGYPHQGSLNAKTTLIPLFLEGGSLATHPDFLFISEKIFAENSRSEEELLRQYPALRTQIKAISSMGYVKRDREEVIQILAEAFNLDAQKILVFPWMPSELTGHVDLFLAVLNEKTILTPHIPDYLLKSEHLSAKELCYAQEINKFYDSISRQIEEQTSLRPSRIANLAPIRLTASPISALGVDAQHLSTINGLLYKNKFWINSFDKHLSLYPKEAQERFKQEIQKSFSAIGMAFDSFDADHMVGKNGYLHCVSAMKLLLSPKP